MKQIKGSSDIIILCLYPESNGWIVFLANLLSCLLQHLNLLLFLQHFPWWFTEPNILLWDAKIKLSWLCFTFVGNQLVVLVLISKLWTNWGSRARYVTHHRKSAKLAGNHAMLQLLGHKKQFCWRLHRLYFESFLVFLKETELSIYLSLILDMESMELEHGP